MWILSDETEEELKLFNDGPYLVENEEEVINLIISKIQPFGSIYRSGIEVNFENEIASIRYTHHPMRGFNYLTFNLTKIINR